MCHGTNKDHEPEMKTAAPDQDGGPDPKEADVSKLKTSIVPRSGRRKWPWIIGLVAAVAAASIGIPRVRESTNTVASDDADVNSHVTFVAPRVSGQVDHVFVEDSNIVHKGDLLLDLDPEPYQLQVNIARSALNAAKADLEAAEATARGNESVVRSLRFGLQRAMDDVNDKVAALKTRVATLESKKASLAKATADYNRNKRLVATRVISQQDMDAYTEAYLVAQAHMHEALQAVYEARVSLGLPATPQPGRDLSEVPANLDETFSGVRETQGRLMEAASNLGVKGSFTDLPREMIANFLSRYPNQDADQISDQVLEDAPAIKQAKAKLVQADHNLEQATLNLRYCKVYAEIDGAVTRRNVNPGNYVVAGQSLMTIRSLTTHDDSITQ